MSSDNKPEYMFFAAHIDDGSVARFQRACLDSVARSVRELHLLVDSPGGNTSAAIGMFTFMRALPIQFTTYNMGSVDSAALIPFLAADKRLACEHAAFLFHRVSIPAPKHDPDRSYLQFMIRRMREEEDRIYGLVLGRTQFRNLRAVRDAYDHNGQRSAAWALEQGIVHEIGDPQIPPGTTIPTISDPPER